MEAAADGERERVLGEQAVDLEEDERVGDDGGLALRDAAQRVVRLRELHLVREARDVAENLVDLLAGGRRRRRLARRRPPLRRT